ncbi:MAG: hypothetical protein WD512_09445 [Candidatus Paceibacterota bacterium]
MRKQLELDKRDPQLFTIDLSDDKDSSRKLKISPEERWVRLNMNSDSDTFIVKNVSEV